MLAVPETLENPETVRVPLAKLVLSGVPFSAATDVAVKPVPVTVVEKIPSGSCPLVPTPVITGVAGGGAGAFRVTVAFALPSGPVAVTESTPPDGSVAGAV